MDINDRIKYLGYKGINLDRINVSKLSNVATILVKEFPNKDYDNLEEKMDKLDKLSLDEVKDITKQFCDKHFTLHNVNTLDLSKCNMDEITSSKNGIEFYDKVNDLLEEKSAHDLNIKLVKGHSMVGKIVKPLLITPDYLTEENRKVYYSDIELGEQLNLLSACTLMHEIAHSQQEQKLGYTADYLNKEMISIFLERVMAEELDSSGELLKLSERVRFGDLITRYSNMLLGENNLNNEHKIENLVYIKSILNAQKLFDMYQKERKQKHKNKYFEDIQKVFDGEKTVDNILYEKEINIDKCQDLSLLKRHL